MKRLWTRTWPEPGSGTATSTTAKSLCLGAPRGRATRWISLLLPEDFIWDTPERGITTQPAWPVGLMRISLSETRCGWPTAKAIDRLCCRPAAPGLAQRDPHQADRPSRLSRYPPFRSVPDEV